MAIKVKAIERNVSFVKGEEKWAYVLQADRDGERIKLSKGNFSAEVSRENPERATEPSVGYEPYVLVNANKLRALKAAT